MRVITLTPNAFAFARECAIPANVQGEKAAVQGRSARTAESCVASFRSVLRFLTSSATTRFGNSSKISRRYAPLRGNMESPLSAVPPIAPDLLDPLLSGSTSSRRALDREDLRHRGHPLHLVMGRRSVDAILVVTTVAATEVRRIAHGVVPTAPSLPGSGGR